MRSAMVGNARNTYNRCTSVRLLATFRARYRPRHCSSSSEDDDGNDNEDDDDYYDDDDDDVRRGKKLSPLPRSSP